MFILGLIAASIVSFPSLACGNQVLSSTFLLLYGGLTLVINSKFYLIFVREHVLITQLCLTLCNPMNGSPPGSSVHGILQARRRVGCHSLLQGICLTQGLNLDLLHCRQNFYLQPPGKSREHGMCCFSWFFFSLVCVLTSSLLHEKMYTVLNSEF